MQSTSPYVDASPVEVRIIWMADADHEFKAHVAVPFDGPTMVQTGV